MYKKKKRKSTKQEIPIIEQDENFAYIVGYTPAGFPYGITWEEQAQFDRQEKLLEEKKKQADRIVRSAIK